MCRELDIYFCFNPPPPDTHYVIIGTHIYITINLNIVQIEESKEHVLSIYLCNQEECCFLQYPYKQVYMYDKYKQIYMYDKWPGYVYLIYLGVNIMT